MLSLLSGTPTHAQGARHVDWIDANGPLSQTMLGYLTRAINQAEADGAAALVVQLDTPGGEVTLIHDMVQTIRSSRVPIIVYVAPRGAWAASAGTLITLAGHVAAMAPETTIGAASPIGSSDQGPTELPETYKRKLVEEMQAMVRSLATRRSSQAVQFAQDTIEHAKAASAPEALEYGLVDFIATDRDDLLRQVDGFEVEVNGRMVKLQTAGATLNRIVASPAEWLLNILANPNISFLLLAVGVQALLIELSNPGMWVPGFVGVVCLALFIYSIGVIPVNLLGLVFIATAFVLFILDVKAPTHGAMTAAGIASFIAGALVMFNGPLQPGQIRFQPISIPLVVGVGLLNGAFFAFIVGKAIQAQRFPVAMGINTLIGKTGEARTDLNPTGTVLAASELWTAEAQDENIPAGTPVQIIGIEGVTLLVKRKNG
jgi:membrane-bound serine protease (ClpP class)